MNDRLDEAMRQWSADTAEAGPPPEIEQRVLAAFDRSVHARRMSWLGAGAVAAALAAVVWTSQTRSDAVSDPPTPPGFVALPYVVQPALYERTAVVRATVPVAELLAAGLQLQADPGGLVQVDLVVGQDGRARSIRLAEDFE